MIRAYRLTNGEPEEVSVGVIGRGARSARQVIAWAERAVTDGKPWAETRDFALSADGFALFDWPAPAAGKVLVRDVRPVGGDLTGMPTPQTVVGDLVFASSEIDYVPPFPASITKLQLLLALRDVASPSVVSTAEINAWVQDRVFPAGIIAAFDAASVPTEIRDMARWKLADGSGDVLWSDPLLSLLKGAMGATEAEFEGFWRAAAGIET